MACFSSKRGKHVKVSKVVTSPEEANYVFVSLNASDQGVIVAWRKLLMLSAPDSTGLDWKRTFTNG